MIVQEALRCVQTIGFYGLSGRGFNNPVDMAIDSRGVIYVLNRAGPEVESRMNYKRITVCNLDEDYLGTFSTGGTADGQIMWPCSIAIDRDENLYISDEALHRISIFDKDGTFLGKWGAFGDGDGQFNRPAGIAFDPDDNLLVVDGANHRVQRYGKDGTYMGSFGSYGSGEGQLSTPWGICLDDEANIFVADWRNDRIQKFSTDGTCMETFGSPGDQDGKFNRPSSVAVDSSGNIYVADWGNERVQVLGPDGSFLAKMRGDGGMSKWGQDYLDANLEELEERAKADLEPSPNASPNDFLRDESASIEKLFWGPISVKLDAHGRLYVVESCRHRIQIYDTRAWNI